MILRGRRGPSLARDQSCRKTAVSLSLALGLSAAIAGCGGAATQSAQRSAHLAPLLASSSAVVAREAGPPTGTPAGAPTSTPVVTSQTATKHTPSMPLAGNIVTVDPGHNGGNFTHPQEIARQVYDGNGYKECDTTGTAAPDGYRETDFNWSVGVDLRRLLATSGAHVVMTRQSNDGVGPCVNERAAIGNRAHSSAAISIHADGGPPGGSGFAILVPAPIPSGRNDAIIAPSRRLANDLRPALERMGLHPSTYDGVNGIAPRTDLGGLNLSRVPKVLVEVGNMQNGPDEAPMERPAFRERVARALFEGLAQFLRQR
jgi:N-acetylmuramoyl-L-alanine amidase